MASNSDQWTGQHMFVRMKKPPYTVTGKIERLVPGQGVVLQVWTEGRGYQRLEIASDDIEDLNVQEAPPPPQQRSLPPQPPVPIAPVAPAIAPQQRQPYSAYPTPPAHFLAAGYPYNQQHQHQHQHHPHHQHAIPSPIPLGVFQPASQAAAAPAAPAGQPKSAFVDPAIVSMGKPPARPSPIPTNVNDVPSSTASPTTAHKPFGAPHVASSQVSNGVTAHSPLPHVHHVGSVSNQDAQQPKTVLVEAMESLTVRAELADEPVEAAPSANNEAAAEGQEPQSAQRKNRRRGGQRKKNGNDNLGAAETSPAKKGKGWRETPMLENTSSFQPYKALRRTKATQDGWQSEDVTDVQEMGEFDFEGSLRKFDKRTIFDEMKEKDQVEESDRLVSHNLARPKAKPGTAGGKNLHYSENVLDMAPPAEKLNKAPLDDFWKSEADDGARNGSEKLSGRELGSRQSSRRGEGKTAATRRSQSRKASTANVGQAVPTRNNSGVSVPKPARRRRKAKHADAQDKLPTPVHAGSSAGFVLPPSNRKIEILSPLQMLNLENIAQNDLGLTEDMMTENAARGIAEVALHTLTDPAIKVRLAAADGSSTETPATIVILAGNNKSGYRSVAAARHLRNKGCNVILCVVGIERERELSVDMTKQLRLFKNLGGKVCNKSELFEFVRKASIPVISMDAPRSVMPQAPPMAVTLIIDALLGHVTPFEDLRASDQATVYELIEWTNRNEAFVLAVDVPTGIDHTTGAPTVQDGHSLYIRPRYVVSIGAPKKGLFEIIAAGAEDDEDTVTGHASDDAVLDWNLFLIDIGLGAAVWKRAGTKIRRGIDFGHRWAMQIKYQSSEADQAEE